MNTLVMVNTLTSIEARAYGSHCIEWFAMGKEYGSKGESFIIHTPHRCSIDRARNLAVQEALLWDCDYLLFIDDDMIIQPHTYKRLREADKDICMAHSLVRGYPFDAMHFIDPADKGFKSDKENCDSLVHFNDYKSYVDPQGLVRVDAIGCATVLFKTKIFKDVEPPWFVTLPHMTEDVYFCLKAQRRFGRQKLQVYVHTGCPTAHIMDPEIVYPSIAEKMKERYEEDNPELKKQADMLKDRGTGYADNIVDSFKQFELELENVNS